MRYVRTVNTPDRKSNHFFKILFFEFAPDFVEFECGTPDDNWGKIRCKNN